MRRLFFIVFLLSFSFKASAPSQHVFFILESAPIEPFNRLIYAVGMVEGKGDTLAYNILEKATGFFQIRPIRLEHYNKRTGSHYKMKDLFNYEVSEKVFLYFASQIGPYDFEKISKNWNGSGAKTILYWKKIKQYL